MPARKAAQISSRPQTLPPVLVDKILEKLGFSYRPDANVNGLKALYYAWCRSVAMDDVLWRIHEANDFQGPPPGFEPIDFFEDWLAYGTGGLCLPVAVAMHSLLTELGFDSRPVLTWMPESCPNATLLVECEDNFYFVNQSVMHSQPILLDESVAETTPGWALRLVKEGPRWSYKWKTFRADETADGISCWFEPKQFASRERSLETLAKVSETYATRKDLTRYNFNLCATMFKDDTLMRLSESERLVLVDKTGNPTRKTITRDQAIEIMANDYGFKEEILAQLPPDEPSYLLTVQKP
jgi:arylamine N-acetyltransferase